jgi:hypothetical protein
MILTILCKGHHYEKTEYVYFDNVWRSVDLCRVMQPSGGVSGAFYAFSPLPGLAGVDGYQNSKRQTDLSQNL